MAANAAGTKAYVANSGGTTLSVIETTVTPGTPPTVTVKVAATVPLVRGNPNAVALNATETIAYVAHGDGWISVVDTNSYTVTAFPTIAGYGLKGIAVNTTARACTPAALDGCKPRDRLDLPPGVVAPDSPAIRAQRYRGEPAGPAVCVGAWQTARLLAVINDPNSAPPSPVNVPLGVASRRRCGGASPWHLVYVTNQRSRVSPWSTPDQHRGDAGRGHQVARSPWGSQWIRAASIFV